MTCDIVFLLSQQHEYVCVRACVRACMRVCVHVHAWIYMHAHMHVCEYISLNVVNLSTYKRDLFNKFKTKGGILWPV